VLYPVELCNRSKLLCAANMHKMHKIKKCFPNLIALIAYIVGYKPDQSAFSIALPGMAVLKRSPPCMVRQAHHDIFFS
jgi:hypothetical protein